MDRYQDAFRPDGSVAGERDCAPRWDLISDMIPSRGTILDVGSNLGYFGLRLAAERPEVSVISIESDPLIAERQAALIDENLADRITLVQGSLTAAACETWSETCDHLDATLLLAVIHWFDDPARAVAALASMSGIVIAEVPHPNDAGACGQEKLRLWGDPVRWFEEVTQRPARVIGRMARHTSDTPSYVVAIEGGYERQPTRPYWDGAPSAGDRDYRVRHAEARTRLWVRGQEQARTTGVNLHNLMHLGALVRPEPATWRAWFKDALAAASGHQDPLPHNALWNHGGLVLIDDEPRDALTTPTDGLRSLDSGLQRWTSGDTARGVVEVRTLTRLQRLHRSPAGQGIAKRVPVAVRRRLRGPLRKLSELRRVGPGGGSRSRAVKDCR